MSKRRFLDLFSGIGGLAAALGADDEVVAAVDHDLKAQRVAGANWAHRREVKNLAAVRADWLASFDADVWWMSPPCTPHGIRGHQQDLDDPRAAAFRRVVEHVAVVRPPQLALENVPWFAGSRAWALLAQTLTDAGYEVAHAELCPSQLGLPAQRRRFYAVASRTGPLRVTPPVPHPTPLARHLGPWRAGLELPDAVRARFLDALHVVDADDPHAVAATFTRAYGNSPVYAGSYLRQPRADGVLDLRRFAPEEIASLHGMPPGFHFDGLPDRDAWKLVGNGVASQVVRHVLSWLPDAAVSTPAPA